MINRNAILQNGFHSRKAFRSKLPFRKIQFHEEKKILLLSYFFLLFVGPLASSFRGFKPPLGLSRYQDTIQGKFLRHI